LLDWNLGFTAYSQLGCIPELPLEALAVTKFSLLSRGWQLKLVGSFAIVGTLKTAVGESVNAQIVPDNTLGAESSVVTPIPNIQGIPSDQIDGGATRGANLFHSFSQFNIGAGRGAYFTNPAGILNILTRVTGANRSEILGRLGVNGPANLFLINPNGIIFGPNASLDVQGSFLATTADAVKLGDAGLFSASQPATSNLLTVNPSALWFNAVAAQPIVNQSQAPSPINQPNSDDGPPGLQVQPGRTLALLGGDVLLERGNLTAAKGRIELGSVAGMGQVSLSQSGNGFVLGYDSINDFGNISLSNGAFVDASGEGGGDIQIRGARLEMTQSSNIWANTLGAENGGEVLVRTTEIELSESSYMFAAVARTGTGSGGDLRIDTERLLVRDGAQVLANTLGTGKGGSLQITAADSVELIGTSLDGRFSSGLFAQSEGSGDAGELTIVTRHLLVRDGAGVSADTYGAGKGGSLRITAADSVELIGKSADGQIGSGLVAQSEGSGDAGNLTIDTQRLLVRDGGAGVSVSTIGAGKGGSLLITAAESVEVIGDGRSLSVLSAQSEGSGDAGNLTIVTRRLLVRDGAQVAAATLAEGKGGSLRITAADSVEVIGTSADALVASALSTQSEGSGEAGNLTIDTQRLLVRDGAQVAAGTFDAGKGGSLRITAADSVEVIGTSADGRFSSALSTQSEGSGEAGDLRIDTGRLLVRDEAVVSANTAGEGKGGSLQITTSEEVEVIGTSADGRRPSGLSAQSEGNGDAGDLTIDTPRLLVRDGAVISSRSSGEGTAGNIDIRVRDTLQANNGTIATASEQSSGGNITITASNIRLFGNSDITTRVNSGAGDSGDINLKAGSILAFDDSDILAYAENGTGGDITLDTPAFFGENYRPAPRNTDPDTLDRNNRVDVNATGAVEGVITIPDVSSIQNSLTELPENQIDTDSLLASSCIVRRNQPTLGSFTITGTGGFPQRPGDAQMSSYPTVDIETLPSDGTPTNTNPNRPWQKGDPIVEPQGVYRLPNGKIVLSRECP
jgi:filamentous hemagglutinin family protein